MDSFSWDAVFFPNLRRFGVAWHFIIACKNGYGKEINRNVKILWACQKFKAESNSFFFKVIAKRPVSQHFKKGEMRSIPYRIDVAGADTLLIVR